jgi:hypothetical protein
MKCHWIEFTEDWTPSPMTFWVHIPVKADPSTFNPPAPAWIPGKGYPVFYVEVDGFTFQFASPDEMRVCIEVLAKKLLPNTLRLAKDRGGNPDEHWLRKMPDETKPWRYREKAVKYLTKALGEFEREVRR